MPKIELNLITDRTQADAALAKSLNAAGWSNLSELEKEMWDAGLKGSYNASDMNRVAQAVEIIAGRLSQYGYSVSVSPVLTWTDKDYPTEEQFQAYLDDIRSLRAVLQVPPSTPQVPPDMNDLSVQEANAIEQILFNINLAIERMLGSFKRCGQFTFWSGTQPLPAAESNMGRTWGELDAMNTTWANWQVADWYLLLYGNLQAEGVVG